MNGPAPPEGSTWDYQGDNSIGAVVEFTCSDNGNTFTSYCKEDGYWSVPNGLCQSHYDGKSCSANGPTLPAGATSDFDPIHTRIGTFVTIKCYNAAQEELTYVVECQENGEWSSLPENSSCF